MKSRFHKAADEDVSRNFHYYNEASEGLGYQFIVELRAAVDFLEQFPEGARTVAGDVRGKPLVRFPHTLLYVTNSNEVVILAVAHQRQDFDAWVRIAQARRPSNSA